MSTKIYTLAHEAKMEDNDFCSMIEEWTGISLDTPVSDKSDGDRPTIRDRLLDPDETGKEDFFKFVGLDIQELIKLWAKEVGFQKDICTLIATKALKKYGIYKTGNYTKNYGKRELFYMLIFVICVLPS